MRAVGPIAVDSKEVLNQACFSQRKSIYPAPRHLPPKRNRTKESWRLLLPAEGSAGFYTFLIWSQLSLSSLNMSASPEVIQPQGWKLMGSSCTKLISGDASSSGDECNMKVRKPYTITKQRERWTESEHQKFLEALKLYGRAWRRIEEYIGTKTAVQIRSHAQKFFSKLEREASTGSSAGKVQDIEIPPPRPKRKPSHPYPKKAGNSPLNLEDETKEPSALSSAGHREGFQSGSFNPYISKGLGSGSAAFYRNSLVPGHFFGPQGSMKLFGKTVVVPKNHKSASQNDSSKECLLNGEFPFPSTQTNKAYLQQAAGFSPISKVRKDVEIISEEPLHSDRNGSYLVINPSEGTGTLSASDGLTDSHFLSEGEEQQQGVRVKMRKIENTFASSQKGGAKLDVQFPHGTHQNNSIHHWMDNFFRYHSGLSLPPMAGHGVPHGAPTNPLTYWQFIQASAVNYAAYTAAMAAAAATGWTGSITGNEESTEASQANVNEAQVLSSLESDLSPGVLPSAATSWRPFRGFMPPGYSPMGTVLQGEQLDTAANAHPFEYGKEDASLECNSSQGGEHTMDLETADEGETCEPFSKVDLEDGNKNHTENSPSAKSGCTLGTSCVTEVPVSESVLPDSESQHEMDAMVMRAKCCTQESDTERRDSTESPQSLYSSSDEFERQVKKQGEGSSSGSNTPASRFQSSEYEVPTLLESKKRDSYTLFENNDDICSDAFKESHQLCDIDTMESPKVRVKHTEKGRKHQQKDSRHGGGDDSKRLKGCAHEIELRKEVSQEGRKAFRALFTSKLLPQTFPAANMVEGMYTCFKNEGVSRPTVSKKESDSINVLVPMEKASGECMNPDGGSPQEVNGEVHIGGNFSSSTSANVEMGFGQHEGNSKSFTVSSSSGFVPYRRPRCAQAKIPEPSLF